ncbi:MAG: HAD family phosphatase [Acutalibacter sp.]|nr:HAD family phosphatase [Acutalibacter sp.]
MIKLLAFDLDGTTIVDHWELPEPNRLALLAAAERGVELVPATGRMLDFLPKSVRALPVRYVITSNGGMVYDLQEDRPLEENLISNSQALEIQEILEDYDLYIEYYTHGGAVTSRDLRRRALAGMLPKKKHWLVEGKDYHLVEDLGHMLRETGICPEKLNLPYLAPGIREELWGRLRALGGLRITSSIADNMEINSEAAHKGAALKALAGALGLKREELMAIGDNGNDLTMLQAAGCSVAVADGASEALAAAAHVTAAHDQWGLAEAVRRYIL